MSGKLPSGKLKITILSWKNIFKNVFSGINLFSGVEKDESATTNKRSPNDHVAKNYPNKWTCQNSFEPISSLPSSFSMFNAANCIPQRLCAMWTPAMRELERGKLLSIWSLTIIAIHCKWYVQKHVSINNNRLPTFVTVFMYLHVFAIYQHL